MHPFSRTFRGRSDWNGRSSQPSDFRFVNDQDFNSARGFRSVPCSERQVVYRPAQDLLQGPYSTPRQRTGLNATTENVYAANDAERRERRHDRRRPNVDHLSHGFADLNIGTGRSRGDRSNRNCCWNNEYMPAAPEAPLELPRNGEYYLDRACRRSKTYQDNYNDAYQYMHGQRPRHHTALSTLHDPREYAGLNLRFATQRTRHHDPSDSFRDRVRRWF